MFNEYFTKNYYELSKRAEEKLTEVLEIIQFFVGKFEAQEEFNKTKQENKFNMPVISYKGDTEQEMKFQGKTIHKNKKCNTWYTRYRQDGKQIYISGKTQKEVLLELKSQLNYTKKEKKKTLTLLDWYNQWLELFKIGKVKQSTILVYNGLIKKIPIDIKEKDITKITGIEITKIINSIKFERTKQKLYELLNDIFTKAEKHNICNNILKIIDKPKHIRENGIALTTKDRLNFEKYCIKNKYEVFLIALYQGLRKGEILGLTWDNVDYNNNELTINKNFNQNNEFDTTKNITSNRVMPLFEQSKKILQKLTIKNTRVFEYSQRQLQNHFQKIIKELNLNTKYTIHSLRHTFITYCQDNNIPEHIIQNWVGHQIGSNVTSQVYTHIQSDTNKLFINKLNSTKFYSNSTHE